MCLLLGLLGGVPAAIDLCMLLLMPTALLLLLGPCLKLEELPPLPLLPPALRMLVAGVLMRPGKRAVPETGPQPLGS